MLNGFHWFQPIYICPHRLLFATAGLDSANDIIRYSLDDKVTSIIIKENALAVRIAIDEKYKAIYWIKYISQFMYNILKTDYNGTTSIVQNITVTSSDIAIGLGKRVYYILDPPNSQILKFNKSNNVLVGNITTFSNPLDMIVARGKNAICYLTQLKCLAQLNYIFELGLISSAEEHCIQN